MWKQLIELWRSDDLLDQAYIDSFEMMSVAHEMCIEAIRVLREVDNSTVNEEIRNKDKIVNALIAIKRLAFVNERLIAPRFISGPIL